MLSDKIWITRKTRIYTEQRLQENANITQALVVDYSLALVSLSIWNLQNNDPKLNVLSAFASIVVLVLSVYLSAQKYSERSIAMRNCYIKLDDLNFRAKRAEANNDEKDLEKIESEYTSILLNIENHSEYDYLCLRYSLKSKENVTLPQFTSGDQFQYWLLKMWRIFVLLVIFVLPIPVIVCIWL